MRDVGHSSSSSSALRVAVRLVSSRRRHWNSVDALLRADMALAASLMHRMMSPIPKPKDMVRSDLTEFHGSIASLAQTCVPSQGLVGGGIPLNRINLSAAWPYRAVLRDAHEAPKPALKLGRSGDHPMGTFEGIFREPTLAIAFLHNDSYHNP